MRFTATTAAYRFRFVGQARRLPSSGQMASGRESTLGTTSPHGETGAQLRFMIAGLLHAIRTYFSDALSSSWWARRSATRKSA